MAQTIKLRRSATQQNVPTTAQLDLGELAINTHDGKIYFEKNDGSPSIQTIVTTDSQTTGSIEITGNISGSASSTGSFGHVKLASSTAPRTLEITAGNNQDAEIRLHNTNNTIGHSIVMNDSSNRAMYFKYHNGSSTGTTYMTFDGANGNVGIGGAIDPNTDLQIGGYSGTRAVTIATGNNEDAELRFHNTNNTIGHSIVFNDSSGRSLYFKRHSGSSTGTTYMTMNGTTGDVEFAGNISGSSITTGSFGSIELPSTGTFKIPQPGGGTFKIYTSGNQTYIEGGTIRLNSSQALRGTTFQTNEITTFGNGKDAIDIGEGYTGGIRWGYVEIFSNDSNSWTAGQAQLTVAPASGSLEGIKLVGNDLQTGDYIKIQSGSSNVLNITAAGNISGSATSTGSFGAVSIGKGTADNARALTIVGDVQLDNNAKIYFKRSTGTADPFIGYNSSDNFQIFNPLSTEIQFAIGSGEIVVVDGGGLTFNGSKYIAAGGGSGVLSVIGNSGLKLKSGAGGGSGPIELIQGSTTYWSVGASGALTGSADLVMNAGKNISGSATSTGSFGQGYFDGHVGIQAAPNSNELNVGGSGFVKAQYFRGTKFYYHSNNAGMGVGSNLIYFDDNDLVRVFQIKRDGGVQISGSADSTGSFGDGRIAGKLGIQTTTPRGPIDVKGSNGSQGFYVSDTGLKAYLPTDIAHSAGAGTFDLQVENLRLGRSGYGAVTVYPRFNSMLQLGTQDDTNLLTLSGSTQISGSATSTGSFGQVDAADIVHVKNLTIRGAGNNVAIGDDGTGESLTEGTYGSVAIGSHALSAHNGSNQNIAIGHNAMKERTAGSDTIAIGTGAGGIGGGDVGDKNVLLGVNSGYNLDGSGGTYNAGSNVYIGYHAGEDATSGLKNAAVGANAGKDLVAGSSNVFLGHYAGNGGNTEGGTFLGEYTTTAGNTTNEIVIGNGAIGKGSHTVVLGDDRVTDIYMSEDVGAKLHTGDVSGSAASTGSFGSLIIADAVQSNLKLNNGLTLAGSGPNINGDGGNVYMTPTNFIVRSNITNDDGVGVKVGHNLYPGTDNSHNLGASDKRWANIYSADLQLSNEGTEGNEVDGTTGKWTIQEGDEDLFIINRKTGKKYKFLLEEVTT